MQSLHGTLPYALLTPEKDKDFLQRRTSSRTEHEATNDCLTPLAADKNSRDRNLLGISREHGNIINVEIVWGYMGIIIPTSLRRTSKRLRPESLAPTF